MNGSRAAIQALQEIGQSYAHALQSAEILQGLVNEWDETARAEPETAPAATVATSEWTEPELQQLLVHIDEMPVFPAGAQPGSSFGLPSPMSSAPDVSWLQYDPLAGGTGLVGLDGAFSSHHLASETGAATFSFSPGSGWPQDWPTQ